MNEPEIQHLIRNDLRRAIARYGEPPDHNSMQCSPWLAMSLLQKSIRRGHEQLALRAVSGCLPGYDGR